MKLLTSFFLLFLTLSAATSPDTAALKSFKSEINPDSIPPYSCLSSWNFTSTTNPCSLPRVNYFTCGISCTDSRVTQLALDSAGYSGTLTSLISELTHLTLLDLSDNNFSGQIPSSISSLHNLQTLILRSNSFSGLVPNSLTSLKSLQSLDFSRNSITGTIPNLNPLTNLRRLDLSINKLSGPIPKLPIALIELALKGNSLSGSVSESSFTELTQLEVIELSDNSLTGIIPPWVFLLQSIQQVDLANNSFTRVEIWKPTLSNNGNSNLMAVNIGFNKLEGNLPVNFSDYPLLSSLNLQCNMLTGPIPEEYGEKMTLKRIFLDGNFLSGSPPKEFFSGNVTVSGSLGNNCLRYCPTSSELCLKSQKSASICRQAN